MEHLGENTQAKVTHRYSASDERVFEAWLDPVAVREWLAASMRSQGVPDNVQRIEIEPEVGGQFLFTVERQGISWAHWGRYLAIHRPHKIAFTWAGRVEEDFDPDEVTVVILPADHGSVVTLTQTIGEQKVPREEVERGWLAVLSAIDLFLQRSEGTPPNGGA